MKPKVVSWIMTSAIVLTLGQSAFAHPGRTLLSTFEFYATGQGDLTGVCIDQPATPPQLAPLGSCVSATPAPGEDHVEIGVHDSQGNPVYFTVRQDGNPNFGWGCGTLTSPPGGLFPINDWSDVLVFPWAGPGLNDALEPGGSICPGSLDTNLVHPGAVGTVRFTFHDHVADPIPPSATPEDLVTEFRAALLESAEDSQAYNSTNVSSGNGESCSITPYDVAAGSFRGAGFGTGQVRIENVVVEAGDFALFEVECFGQDTNAFTANADYWFEYRFAPNDWRQVGTALGCAGASQPGGSVRTQAAAFTVPGPDTRCGFRQFYGEDDPVITVPHRLHVHLTTTNGVDMHGISLPWPSRIGT
jgi:hypothetical protein